MLHKTSKLEISRKSGISVPPPAVLHVEKKKKISAVHTLVQNYLAWTIQA